ncbi:hypothetical protein M408DRAFT_231853 [Serendipita vermifera MAFF 305830]|uniref:Uncharacterized protein n=1 Tax=Serendipita vermifera MAFF 305830 TaxID=933852 RepID=A0A0C3AZJ4_SERVB|nr:hypothetical protein M408DRAFT_231853 [Serendipita vermifera MAFF 305830]
MADRVEPIVTSFAEGGVSGYSSDSSGGFASPTQPTTVDGSLSYVLLGLCRGRVRTGIDRDTGMRGGRR